MSSLDSEGLLSAAGLLKRYAVVRADCSPAVDCRLFMSNTIIAFRPP